MKPKRSKGFIQVNELLSQKITQDKLKKAFNKHRAIKYWEEVVGGILGDAAQQAKAVDLRNGVLVVACLSQELAYQIKLLANRIIEEINRLAGFRVVFALYVES